MKCFQSCLPKLIFKRFDLNWEQIENVCRHYTEKLEKHLKFADICKILSAVLKVHKVSEALVKAFSIILENSF